MTVVLRRVRLIEETTARWGPVVSGRFGVVPLTRNQALLLRAFSSWTIYVWATRLWNIWRDEARDLPFKVVHSVLALVSVGLAVAALVVVQRNRRSRPAAPEPDRVGT